MTGFKGIIDRNLILLIGDAGENTAIKTLLESHSKNVQVSSTKGEMRQSSELHCDCSNRPLEEYER